MLRRTGSRASSTSRRGLTNCRASTGPSGSSPKPSLRLEPASAAPSSRLCDRLASVESGRRTSPSSAAHDFHRVAADNVLGWISRRPVRMSVALHTFEAALHPLDDLIYCETRRPLARGIFLEGCEEL